MHPNRISSFDWNPQPAAVAASTSNPMMAFAVCPISGPVPAWQAQIYQAAIAQAQMSAAPTAMDHAMGLSLN